ncbi:MAG: PIN domain-containing protein [Nevskiales bacterium]
MRCCGTTIRSKQRVAPAPHRSSFAGCASRIHRSRAVERNLAALDQFLSPLAVVDFNRDDAVACGRLRAALESFGRAIGPYDLQIAAQALTRKLKLVTNNQREFARVPGLRVENWS